MGYSTSGIAENISQSWLYSSIDYVDGVEKYIWQTQEDIAQKMVTGWMNSPDHRVNMLDKTYDREGIGVAVGEFNQVLITQNFC